MAVDLLCLIAGIVVVALTLSDVFDTVVVPGGSRASLHVARRLSAAMLPVWKAVRGRRRGLSAVFAPTILVGCFIIWMTLLDLGFALISWAARSQFEPSLRSFWDGLYLVGSSLVTVGLSHIHPTGAARWVVLAAGFCGLAVMTMAVTYLLEVQSSISKRDVGIIKLNTVAGDPPSGLRLLEKYAMIGSAAELPAVLRECRDWCATVRQSHTAHPSLIYFQSIGTGAGWPAALGAILDMALIAERMLAEPHLRGPGILLREEGTRMARELALLLKLKPEPSPGQADQLREVAARLKQAGFKMAATDMDALAAERAEHDGCIRALADHLGKPSAVLLP